MIRTSRASFLVVLWIIKVILIHGFLLAFLACSIIFLIYGLWMWHTVGIFHHAWVTPKIEIQNWISDFTSFLLFLISLSSYLYWLLRNPRLLLQYHQSRRYHRPCSVFRHRWFTSCTGPWTLHILQIRLLLVNLLHFKMVYRPLVILIPIIPF